MFHVTYEYSPVHTCFLMGLNKALLYFTLRYVTLRYFTLDFTLRYVTLIICGSLQAMVRGDVCNSPVALEAGVSLLTGYILSSTTNAVVSKKWTMGGGSGSGSGGRGDLLIESTTLFGVTHYLTHDWNPLPRYSSPASKRKDKDS